MRGKCEVDERACPWLPVLERVSVLDGQLFDEHPLLLELEKLPKEESKAKHSNFLRRLEKGSAVAVETPVAAIMKEEDIIKILSEVPATLYTIPDNPLGYPHFSSTALATHLKALGAEVMPHITTKDRNLSALTAELKTALLFRFEAVLLTTGDWPSLMLPSKAVFDLDSSNLIRLAKLIFSGVLPTKEVLDANLSERPVITATLNPNYPVKLESKRAARKLIAGAELFFTQVVATRKAVRRIEEILSEAKKYTKLEADVDVSLLYPLKEDLIPVLERMGIETGDSFEDVLEEVKSLDFGGVNLIVLSHSLDEWLTLWKEAYKKVEEVLR
ncbi:5,10-methylenetetrahydrofolate reductase [Thermococcus sp. M39]|uniref:5,10-methylenetetrahydrofolate reductase n=1 Tax=unclassified Thermococcus TaxID=2627626 RepID=UPI001439A177|nr:MULTISPECIES: 5,10-methylenetetrahydrofolate reductase [unclassified Thermococcus]NJE09179.1 5,10-methylenetetrahydrofolate reductase [Thermococcus sp. M39]NJE13098.1 5,10-methylenetetrahydrofolate reductase [Thermococcus sp. LS2]